MVRSTNNKVADIGFVVDAGPEVGYGHVVRCLRIAEGLAGDAKIDFYPLSEPCARFLSDRDFPVRFDDTSRFPALVVSDLYRIHPVTDRVGAEGCHHISIRDLGLAQCDSDIVIDGSITQVVPYGADPGRKMFVGPDYTVVDPWQQQRNGTSDEVFVTLGGGVECEYLNAVVNRLTDHGFQVCATEGFDTALQDSSNPRNPLVRWIRNRDEIHQAVSRCLFAITNAGISLYEMLAAGVPMIALSVDELQLKTAAAFEERGAVENAGVMSALHPNEVVERAREMRETPSLMNRLAEAGRRLVDGQGLFRVREIVRRELCPTM